MAGWTNPPLLIPECRLIGVGKGAQAKHQFRAGPARKVPGRRGMSWEEEDWVDEDATAHRGDDE
jgi:hypothetical protein